MQFRLERIGRPRQPAAAASAHSATQSAAAAATQGHAARHRSRLRVDDLIPASWEVHADWIDQLRVSYDLKFHINRLESMRHLRRYGYVYVYI